MKLEDIRDIIFDSSLNILKVVDKILVIQNESLSGPAKERLTKKIDQIGDNLERIAEAVSKIPEN